IEDAGVEVEAIEIVVDRSSDNISCFRAARMAVAPASANPGRVAARMGAADFQVRQPLEHAAEDQACLGDGGFQWIANEISERVSLQSIRRGDLMRVDED